MSNYRKAFGIFFSATILLCATLTAPRAARAEYKLRVVHARGFNAMPRAQARALLDRALIEIRQETGVVLRVRRFQVVRNPYAFLHSDLDRREYIFYHWISWFSERNARADVHFAIVPPIVDSKLYWLFGHAHTCRRGGVAVAAAQMKNAAGAPRVKESFIAIKHELLHVIGARHNEDSDNIMNGGAMHVGSSTIAATSLKEINKCINSSFL